MKFYLKVLEISIEHNAKFLIIKKPEGKNAGGLISFFAWKVESAIQEKI
jgi:8-oxo-dGTP diphosphatase